LLLASTWKQALFRSDDGGVTWRKYGQGLIKNKQADLYGRPHFNRVAVADNAEVFVGGFCGVFRSNDLGTSWYKLEPTLYHIVSLDISPASQAEYSIGITTYAGGAYSSEDKGASWQVNNRSLTNPRLGPIAYSPNYSEDRTVFTATFNHALKSTDGGVSWNSISIQPRKNSVDHFKALALRSLSRFRALSELTSSFNYFRETRDGFAFPILIAISSGFAVDQTVFAATHPNGVMRSLDGGDTFSLIWGSLGTGVRSLVLSPEYPTDRTLFAALREGLYRSTDGGARWKRIGEDQKISGELLAISPQYGRDRTLFAGGASGLFRTRDAGRVWEQLTVDGRNLDEPIAGLAISPFFATDGQLLVQIKGGGLWIAHDGGDRFEELSSESTDAHEFSQLIHRDIAPLMKFSPNYIEDHTIYAASLTHLVKSTDRGRTWHEISRPVRYEVEASFLDWLLLPVSLEGAWNREGGYRFSSRQIIHSNEPQSAATLRYLGSGVSWIGNRGPDRGRAEVYLDGTFSGQVDQYSEVQEELVELFAVQGLAPGPHTITIRVTGSKSEQSSGVRIDIDAFDVRR
jgi:photosystem II stability/assembly factor-like uncharacterized protein